LKIIRTTLSVIISMLAFIIFVKLCVDNQEQYVHALQVLGVYVVLINVYGLLMMYVDKKKSRRGRGRISERQLFVVTALGGSLGTVVGMRLFKHKTRKTSFSLLFPLIFIVEIVAVGVVWYSRL
jgi:uncharacterized membrane protein YsdA (DUF1294 family)